MDENIINERMNIKMQDYNKLLEVYKFSETRYDYFEKIIQYFKRFGNVYIVRLPVSKPFLDLENSVYSQFDDRVLGSSINFDVPYLDLTKDSITYKYIDGNLLYKTSGAKVSIKIANWIKKQSK